MSDPTASPAEKSFTALGSLPDLGGGMKPGRLFILLGKARFECDAGTVEWPLDQIQLTLGGHNDSQLFLSRPADPKASISTGDFSLLDHPAFQHSRLREQIATTRRRSKAVPLGLLGCGTFLLLILVAIVLAFVLRARLTSALANKVPVEWEKSFGDSALKEISTQEKIVTDNAAYNAQVRAVTNALLPALGLPHSNFQFHIIENTNINAFAVPGGQVFIFSGLLKSAKRPEELAGVLAHEIAHVTRRHSLRNIISSAGLWLTVSTLFGNSEGLTAILTDGSRFLLNQKFSRDFEREADDTGWDYLISANVDPRGMIDFFETIKSEQEQSISGHIANQLDFLATHPATDERMKHLRTRWDSMPRKTGFHKLGQE
jgi:Zn-dependent protease with chaperone function